MSRIRPISLVVGLALVAWFVAPMTRADDRSLLRSTSGDPYVFVIFDTSGSMNWSVACTEADSVGDANPWDGACTEECPFDDASCARVCPDFGCLDYEEDADDGTMIEVIVDNDDPSVTTTGSWSTFSNDDTYGANYLYTDGSDKAGITYEATLPGDGEFHFWAWWHRREYRAEDVKVTITDQNGARTRTTEIDQTRAPFGMEFEFIGTFDFEVERKDALGNPVLDVDGNPIIDPVVVTIDNYDSTDADNPKEDGISVSVDAIRFSRLEAPASLTCREDEFGNPIEGYRCTQTLCPRGDCQSRLGADDPFSKFFQAKAALYEVVEKSDTVHWGFSTYEQDNARLRFKHYMYQVSALDDSNNPTKTFSQAIEDAIADGTLSTTDRLETFDWPAVGNQEVFGTGPWDQAVNSTFSYDMNGKGDDNLWDCSDSTRAYGENDFDDDFWVGCTDTYPADVEDIWEMARINRIPKLGATSRAETWVYVRDTDDRVYRVDYEYGGSGATLGDPRIKINLEIHRCISGQNCRSNRDTLVSAMPVFYDLVSPYSEGTGRIGRFPMKNQGFFDNATGPTADGDSTCDGLETNFDFTDNDTDWDDVIAFDSETKARRNFNDDVYFGFTFKWPWQQNSLGDEDVVGNSITPRNTYFDNGDFIPFDWTNNNKNQVLRHLAPNAWELDAGGEVVSVNAGITDPALMVKEEIRLAGYFRDTWDERANTTQRRLKLRDETERPFVPYGATPLYDSMVDFKRWYAGEDGCTGTLTNPCSWSDYAKVLDTSWLCRSKYVLFLTDGEETCEDNRTKVCEETDKLQRSFQVNTFVVGFGLPDAGDALTCMAETGGTGAPFLPRNREELVTALESIVLQVQAESRSFASASIPAVQNTAADKIYLSSFTPIRGLSVWPGRLDAFRQPLPLAADNKPDLDRVCGEEDADGNVLQSECYLWDVADRLVQQAPTLADVEVSNSDPNYRIGDDDTFVDPDTNELTVQNRRVFYGKNNPTDERPGPLRLFYPPELDVTVEPEDITDAASIAEAAAKEAAIEALNLVDYADMAQVLAPDELEDLLDCLAITPTPTCTDEQEDLAEALQSVVGETLRVKQKSIQVERQEFDENGDSIFITEEVACTGLETPCQYVMGDIFHANPQVVASPDDFNFFRQDLCGTPPPRGLPNNCVPASEFGSAGAMRDRGYREFVRRHTWRRRMLTTATNDGQIHFFDAGIYTVVDDDELGKVEVFTDGSGYEIFSYMPRFVMPIVKQQSEGLDEVAESGKHIFSLDGSPRVAEVFIDPVPDVTGAIDPTEREWRTVMIGGVREAGDVFNTTLDVPRVNGYWALDLTLPDPLDPTIDRRTGRESEFAPYPPADPGAFLPGCMAWDEGGRQVAVSGAGTGSEGCGARDTDNGPTPFPLEMWTFNDTINIPHPTTGEPRVFFLDEEVELDLDADSVHKGGYVLDGVTGLPADDHNSIPDLGDTWSSPIVTQVAVCEAGGAACTYERPIGYTGPANGWMDDLETRWVAIFGGGEHPRANPDADAPNRGYWIYMIDIETGEALYKRQVQGTVPSAPAVLDANRDGVADAIYFGTTAGLLYKIDLRSLDDTTSLVPAVETVQIPEEDVIGWTHDVAAGEPDFVEVQRIASSAWDPFPIVETGSPIYYPPALFRVPERDQYGFAFGTGDREDLWREDADYPAHFVVSVDDDFVRRSERPAGTEDSLPMELDEMVNFSYLEALPTLFDGNTLDSAAQENLLLITDTDAGGDGFDDNTGRRAGWVMTFPVDTSSVIDPEENFRATNEPFVTSSILIFSMFQPVIVPGATTPTGGEPVCGRGGRTLAFVVFLQNGQAVGNPVDSDGEPIRACLGRCEEVRDFTTAVHTDRTASKNPPAEGESGGTGRNITDVISEIDEQMADAIRNAIMDQMPRNCQFNPSYEIVISALRSSTGVNVFARIPMVICPGDWKQ